MTTQSYTSCGGERRPPQQFDQVCGWTTTRRCGELGGCGWLAEFDARATRGALTWHGVAVRARCARRNPDRHAPWSLRAQDANPVKARELHRRLAEAHRAQRGIFGGVKIWGWPNATPFDQGAERPVQLTRTQYLQSRPRTYQRKAWGTTEFLFGGPAAASLRVHASMSWEEVTVRIAGTVRGIHETGLRIRDTFADYWRHATDGENQRVRVPARLRGST